MPSSFAIATLFVCASIIGSEAPAVLLRGSSDLTGRALDLHEHAAPITRGSGRSPAPSLIQPITAQHFFNYSALIFSGTVLSVERQAGGQKSPQAVTQITFRVQDGIRGVRRGELIHVREWAGLWNAGERYRTGETLFMFLHPPSKLGLTSPVGGAAGKFLVQDGRVLIRPQHVFFRTGARDSSMDVRDFAALVRRAGRE